MRCFLPRVLDSFLTRRGACEELWMSVANFNEQRTEE